MDTIFETLGMSKKNPTFEEALACLQRIADEIEEGKIGLEESITKYEEGMKIIQHCRAILTTAEQRIIQLRPDAPPVERDAGIDQQELTNPT
jgi:exodeoxyribonuclease VII small subunit